MKLLRKTSRPPDTSAQQLDLFAAELTPALSATNVVTGAVTSASTEATSVATAPTPPPPSSRSATPKRRLHVGNHILEFTLLRSKRRSIGFMIDDDGLRVTAPKWVTLADIDTSIREKQRWILSKLNERRERSARRLQPTMQWRDGAALPYLGGTLTLRIVAAQRNGVVLNTDAKELVVCLPAGSTEQQLKDRVQGWLQQEAKRLFHERLPLYAEKLGVTYRQCALSSATTQWGSCTADGRIRLNWKLIHFSLPLIDYVIAHELSHLREMNHSPQFWATVQSIFPEFESAKKALRLQAPEMLPIF